MTQTVERRPLHRPAPPPRAAAPSPLGPGALAALWAVCAGLVAFAVPVLLGWATDSRSGSGALAATRTAGQLWLLANGTALAVPGGVIGLTPLGLVVLPLALLHRAGRHSARTLGVQSLRRAAELVAVVAFGYSVLAAVLASLAASDDVRPAPVRALLLSAVVAAVGAGSGVVREAGLARQLSAAPPRVRALAPAVAAVVVTLLGGAALLVGGSLVAHSGRVTSLAGATDPGVVGGLELLLLGVVVLPNALVWGVSWLAGPGFAVGVATSVSPFGTTLGPVPAVPVMAALPGGDVPGWALVAALLVPVAAGVLGGVLLARRLPIAAWWRTALEGALLGPCAGAVMAVLALISGGPLGGGRLTAVGPSPWRVGLAVALEVAVPASATVLVVRRLSRRS